MSNKKTTTNQHPSGIVKRALESEKDRNLKYDYEDYKLRISKNQLDKVEEISKVLGISKKSVINVGIKYLIYYSEMREEKARTIKEFPKQLGSASLIVTISIETISRLQAHDLESDVNKSAIAGVKLLHSRMMKIRKRKVKKNG